MLDAWFYINGLIKREGSVIKNISRSDKQWAPFHCLQSFSNSKRFMGKCSLLRRIGELEPEYENIHKLFQLSLILLYDRCSQNKLRVKVENQICNKISHKKMKIEDLIIVKEEVNPEDLIKKDYETDEEFSLRVLGLLKYKFKDLELSKDNATRASYLIQKNLYNGLEEMVNLQPFSQELY